MGNTCTRFVEGVGHPRKSQDAFLQMAVLRTESIDEGCVQLPGEKGVRHVPEELLQQGSNIVNAVLFLQRDIDPTVKLLT